MSDTEAGLVPAAVPGRALAIVHLNTADEGGGAAAVASGLAGASAARGHRVRLVVGRQRGRDPRVVVLPDDDGAAWRLAGYAGTQAALRRLAGRHPNRGFGRTGRTLRFATHPRALLHRLRGDEDFEFPASHRLIDRLGATPDIVHAHNLHGGYFDPRALPALSARVPTVLTLHDMWLLTGHCAHALGCERWTTGCGACPNLRLDPAIRRDRTRENWARKRDLIAQSRLHVATPSRWLRDIVERSMMAPWLKGLRVVPNGVDTAVFRPGNRQAARAALGLPRDAAVVLLTTGSLGSMWKDDRTLRGVMDRLCEHPPSRPALFVSVGRDSVFAVPSRAAHRSAPYQHDPRAMARYYQAADVYLHAARADTCPLAVIEAMACGTPVVATGVGGVPEQIVPAGIADVRAGHVGGATGVLVEPGGAAPMAEAVDALLSNDAARLQMGANAAADAARRFSLDRMVDDYLAWYREILEVPA